MVELATKPFRWSSGNPEVVELFEYWLDQAKQGEIHHAAVGVVKNLDQIAYDYAGKVGLEEKTQRALDILTQEFDALTQAREMGPRNFDLSASHVQWDTVGTPLCWDFFIWLIDAEMTRVRLGGPRPLRVAFTRVDTLDDPSRDFFENVFRPLLPLIGAIEDVDAVGGRHKPLYTPYDIVLAAKAGEKVPIVNASRKGRATMAAWLHGTKPITITLREAKHWEHRNSNVGAWIMFANDLKAAGENVIFVRDTAMANEPVWGHASCPIAAWNVDLRMALYEQAKCNMFVSNGPAGLGLFSDRPYLYFNPVGRDERYAANNPGWWIKSNGIAAGEQWPWALPTQRMIWKADSYMNICDAWEEFQPLLLEKAV